MDEIIENYKDEIKKLEEFKSSFKSHYLSDLDKFDSNRLSYLNGKLEIYTKVLKDLQEVKHGN
ncbi:MAG: hypothetical protein ACRC7S_13415 [Cetobacterium sp.]